MSEKIQRQTQKIFAGNAATDELAVFGSMNTENPIYTDNIETLQSTDYEEGWSSAIAANEAPWLEELNGVQYGLSKQIAYGFQEGIAEWDENTVYYKGSFAKSTDGLGILYKSLTDQNQGNSLTDTTNWEEYYPSRAANTDLSNLSTTGQAKFNQYVAKSGDTMTGTLVSQTNGNTCIQLNNPSNTNGYKEILWTMNNNSGNRLGFVRGEIVSDKEHRLTVTSVDENNTPAGGLIVTYDADTKISSTTAVTPSLNSNATNIATTAWVKSILSSSGNGLATISKNTNGYCKFTNGLIIQWGTGSNLTPGATITYPIAFTSTPSTVCTTDYGLPTLDSKYLIHLYENSPTKFKIGYSGETGGVYSRWIAVGY